MHGSFALRPYQGRLVAALARSMRAHRRVCLQLPTGGGKTIIATALAGKATKGKVLVAAPSIEIAGQFLDAADLIGVDAGMVHGRRDERDGLMVVTTYGTLRSRIETFRSGYSLLVVDEAHHARSDQWDPIFAGVDCRRVLGITATPARLDGRGLGELFEDLVVAGDHDAGYDRLRADGHLVEARVFRSAPLPDMTGVRKRGGDYASEASADRAMVRGRLEAVAEEWRKVAWERPTVAFGATVEHALEMERAFASVGATTMSVVGNSTPADRARAMSGIGRDFQVLAACQVPLEGWDAPVVSCIVSDKATASLTRWIQMCGRALRPSPGKADALILDNVGNGVRLGLPDEDRKWSLAHDRDTEPGDPPCKECLTCGAIVPAGVMQCPHCGCDFPRRDPLEELARNVRWREMLRRLSPAECERGEWLVRFVGFSDGSWGRIAEYVCCRGDGSQPRQWTPSAASLHARVLMRVAGCRDQRSYAAEERRFRVQFARRTWEKGDYVSVRRAKVVAS